MLVVLSPAPSIGLRVGLQNRVIHPFEVLWVPTCLLDGILLVLRSALVVFSHGWWQTSDGLHELAIGIDGRMVLVLSDLTPVRRRAGPCPRARRCLDEEVLIGCILLPHCV